MSNGYIDPNAPGGYISLSRSGTSVSFRKFTDTELPGSFMAQASLEFSQIGTAYASGPARTQRKMWSVSAIVTTEQWEDLVEIYRSWDSSRAQGHNLAEVWLVDALIGSPSSHTVFFTEPPSLSKLAPSNNTDFLATFVAVET